MHTDNRTPPNLLRLGGAANGYEERLVQENKNDDGR